MSNEDTGYKGDSMPDITERPVLSISLLCSGKNTEEITKCLESLMTIRNRVSSEIVIVDTGCRTKARTLIEKYADQVVDFTWCNDFAKARNAGLEKCTGEWFMFVDDDEWFEDTDAIVDFFNSGEYRSYGKARYIIRNYVNYEGTEYNDAWNARLAKVAPGMVFKGKVHEYLYPTGGKIKDLDDYVHHYGYVFIDPAVMYRKEQRNIPLMLEMAEEEPDNAHWPAQLIQEYRNIQAYSDMRRISVSSLEKMRDIDSPAANRYRPDFYEGVLISEVETYQFDKAISDVTAFLTDQRNSEKCNIGLYFYAVEAYWGNRDYQNVFVYARKYLEAYKRISQIEDTSVDDLTFMCGNIFGMDRILYCISRAIAAGVRCGDISVLHDYFDMFDLAYGKEPVIPFCEGVTYALSHFDYDDRYVGYIEAMCEHPYMLALLMNDAMDVEAKSSRCFKRLVNVYGKTHNAVDPYLIYMRILYARLSHEINELRNLYVLFFTYVVGAFDTNDKIWKIADEVKLDLSSVFLEIPFRRWKQDVDLFFEKNGKDNVDKINKVLGILSGEDDIRFHYFRLKLVELSVIRSDEHSVDESLRKYCNACIDFYLEIYKAEIFTGDLTILPDECRFAMEFIKAAGQEPEQRPVDYIKKLEKCGAIYSPFTQAMKQYIRNYGDKKRAELMKRI